MLLQADIDEFIALGSIGAVEDRLLRVGVLEGQLAELRQRSELYQVGGGGLSATAACLCMHRSSRRSCCLPTQTSTARSADASSREHARADCYTCLYPCPCIAPPHHHHPTTTIALIQAREEIFGLPRSEVPLLAAAARAFEPAAALWTAAAAFARKLPEWMDGPFTGAVIEGSNISRAASSQHVTNSVRADQPVRLHCCLQRLTPRRWQLTWIGV